MPEENCSTLAPDTPVRYLKGVSPKTAQRFEKLGILTLAESPVPLPTSVCGFYTALLHCTSPR